MIELTQQQRQAIGQGETPPTIIDPDTKTAYVLVRKDVYEQMRGLLEEGLDMRQVAVLVEQAMQEEDANDSTLDFYQRQYGAKP
jgi:type II secretory pathway component GspD/PulD (secretin)